MQKPSIWYAALLAPRVAVLGLFAVPLALLSAPGLASAAYRITTTIAAPNGLPAFASEVAAGGESVFVAGDAVNIFSPPSPIYEFGASDGALQGQFDNPAAGGSAASLVASGPYIIAGYPYHHLTLLEGAVLVFDRYTRLAVGSVITSPTPTNGDAFGLAVAATAGKIITRDRNKVYVYDLYYHQLLATFAIPGATAGPHSLFAWGHMALIGSPDNNSAYLLDLDTTPMVPTQIAGIAGYGSFGYAVASDGTNLLIGAPNLGASGRGAVHVFDGAGAFARTCTNRNPATDYVYNDRFGSAVVVAGRETVVAAPGPSSVGDRYVFGIDASTCVLQRTILDTSGGANGIAALAAASARLVAASPTISPGTGSVRVYADCGNGVREPGEVCDDANEAGGDCCDLLCQLAGADGLSCDDGNMCTVATQCHAGACVGTCQLGATCTGPCGLSWGCAYHPDGKCACSPAAACGDGILNLGEGCDDGDTVSGDGCSSSCTTELPIGCSATTGAAYLAQYSTDLRFGAVLAKAANLGYDTNVLQSPIICSIDGGTLYGAAVKSLVSPGDYAMLVSSDLVPVAYSTSLYRWVSETQVDIVTASQTIQLHSDGLDVVGPNGDGFGGVIGIIGHDGGYIRSGVPILAGIPLPTCAEIAAASDHCTFNNSFTTAADSLDCQRLVYNCVKAIKGANPWKALQCLVGIFRSGSKCVVLFDRLTSSCTDAPGQLCRTLDCRAGSCWLDSETCVPGVGYLCRSCEACQASGCVSSCPQCSLCTDSGCSDVEVPDPGLPVYADVTIGSNSPAGPRDYPGCFDTCPYCSPPGACGVADVAQMIFLNCARQSLGSCTGHGDFPITAPGACGVDCPLDMVLEAVVDCWSHCVGSNCPVQVVVPNASLDLRSDDLRRSHCCE